jgi:hypothetical protein
MQIFVFFGQLKPIVSPVANMAKKYTQNQIEITKPNTLTLIS